MKIIRASNVKNKKKFLFGRGQALLKEFKKTLSKEELERIHCLGGSYPLVKKEVDNGLDKAGLTERWDDEPEQTCLTDVGDLFYEWLTNGHLFNVI